MNRSWSNDLTQLRLTSEVVGEANAPWGLVTTEEFG